MNYLPYAGYFFYGASNATKRASFAASWGLLETAPASSGFNIWVLVGNAWKKVSAISALVGGVWKAASSLKILVSNAWKDTA